MTYDDTSRGLDWLADFERRRGRRLRVLHVGNVANNAYNNAKIQRQRGIEADVLSYEYYHVMGCPEWEDAEFVGDIGDPFFPDWWAVDLGGYSRPRWFAQGRVVTCIRYLRACHGGGSLERHALWRLLRFELWIRCRSTPTARNVGRLLHWAIRVHHAFKYEPDNSVVQGPISGYRTFVRALRLRLWYLRSYLARARWVTGVALRKAVAATVALTILARGGSLADAALQIFPTRLAHLRDPTPSPVARAEPQAHSELAEAIGTALGGDVTPVPDPAPPPPESERDPEEKRLDLIDRFRELFPDRNDALQYEDYASYLGGVPMWRELFTHYDVVQAYATDGIIPLLSNHPYAVYEHGTLRQTPFDVTAQGRLCALSYRKAPAVFVTNSDVLPSATKLGIDSERLVCLPHAVDSERLETFRAAHEHLRPPAGASVVFLSPTRQDWVDGDPSWSKGNDRAIRALALVRERGFRCTLMLGGWGRHLEASRQLVAELGVEDMVEWLPPLRKRTLWERFLASHAVVDQFVLPAIGGVTFEAMALGCRVITAIDRDQTERFFGEAPPLFDARDPESVATAMIAVINDATDTAGAGAAAGEWFRRYHSADRIVSLQADAYRRLLLE